MSESSTPRVIEGNLVASERRFAIVAGRFNSFLGDSLVGGAVDTLVRHGCDADGIDVYKVPGSFEIPMMAQRVGRSGRYDAVICIGALIRGATPHFDYIAGEVTKGIAAVSLETGVPMTYGVITCDTLEQAIERSGTKAGNKGTEAALAAIEMVDLFRRTDTLEEDG